MYETRIVQFEYADGDQLAKYLNDGWRIQYAQFINVSHPKYDRLEITLYTAMLIREKPDPMREVSDEEARQHRDAAGFPMIDDSIK